MPLPRFARAVLALPVAAIVACAGATPVPGTGPAPGPSGGTTSLPPIPQVDGPLAIRVVYPSANAVVTSRDSNFIFGSIGSGRATLTLNGVADSRGTS